MTVTLYAFDDGDDGALHTFTTFHAQEAKDYGQQHKCRVLAQEYEYNHSETVWDFTIKGGG